MHTFQFFSKTIVLPSPTLQYHQIDYKIKIFCYQKVQQLVNIHQYSGSIHLAVTNLGYLPKARNNWGSQKSECRRILLVSATSGSKFSETNASLPSKEKRSSHLKLKITILDINKTNWRSVIKLCFRTNSDCSIENKLGRQVQIIWHVVNQKRLCTSKDLHY